MYKILIIKVKNMKSRSFTCIPTHLIYLLDNDCLKLMSILIQQESYQINSNIIKEGEYFKLSIINISIDLGFKNRIDTHCVIQALVNSLLIDVKTESQKFEIARFKINWENIEKIQKLKLCEMRLIENRICKLSRKDDLNYYK